MTLFLISCTNIQKTVIPKMIQRENLVWTRKRAIALFKPRKATFERNVWVKSDAKTEGTGSAKALYGHKQAEQLPKQLQQQIVRANFQNIKLKDTNPPPTEIISISYSLLGGSFTETSKLIRLPKRRTNCRNYLLFSIGPLSN